MKLAPVSQNCILLTGQQEATVVQVYATDGFLMSMSGFF